MCAPQYPVVCIDKGGSALCPEWMSFPQTLGRCDFLPLTSPCFDLLSAELYSFLATLRTFCDIATMAETKEQVFDIPEMCKAGVVVNEGPDFHVEVRDVPVPEISMLNLPPLHI